MTSKTITGTARQIPEVVERGDLCVIVRQRSYGDSIQRDAMMKKFVPEKNPGKNADELLLRIYISKVNFVYMATQSELSGAGFELPTASDPLATIQAAYDACMKLPEDFVKDWLSATVRVETTDDPTVKPLEFLTEAEKADPKSKRRVGKRRSASASA